MGHVHFQAGQYNVALPFLKQIRKLQPGDAAAAYNTGTALMKLQRYAEAAAEFEHALTLLKEAPRGRLIDIREKAALAPKPERTNRLHR